VILEESRRRIDASEPKGTGRWRIFGLHPPQDYIYHSDSIPTGGRGENRCNASSVTCFALGAPGSGISWSEILTHSWDLSRGARNLMEASVSFRN